MNRLAAIALLLFGCQADSFDRFNSEEDAVSVMALDGWSQSRQRGSLLFTTPDVLDRTTIAVRSAERQRDTRFGDLVSATATVLDGLDEAKVVGPRPIDHGHLKATSFEVTFIPPKRSERYQRRHVVLLGQERIFHVLHTAPEGELGATQEVFSQVVSSLREEG